MSANSILKILRVVAILEGISYLLLFITMPLNKTTLCNAGAKLFCWNGTWCFIYCLHITCFSGKQPSKMVCENTILCVHRFVDSFWDICCRQEDF